MLYLYWKLAFLRDEPAFASGIMKFASTNDLIFSFIRHTGGYAPYLITLNFGSESATEDYCSTTGALFGQVVLYVAANTDLKNSLLEEGSTINLDSVTLYPGDALVIKIFTDS